MSIEKMMCLSTSHITQQIAETIDYSLVAMDTEDANERPFDPEPWVTQLIIYNHGPHGWLIAIAGQIRPEGETEGYDYRDGVPPELTACMDYATANGCDWLLLDQDADLIDDLPKFDW